MSTPHYPESIKHWPEKERPRERLIQHGPSSLSDAEVLAIILRTGDSATGQNAVDLARRLLSQFGGFRALGRASIAELCEIPGVGSAKAVGIAAALEMGRRSAAEGEGSRRVFRSSAEVAQHYIPLLRDLKKEVFRCVLLDGKNRLIKEVIISEGSLTSSIIHPREAFSPAVRESAASVLFVHNHPSGDPTPSEEDKVITRQLVEAGKILGIHVLDHVIIGEGCSISFADLGMIGREL